MKTNSIVTVFNLLNSAKINEVITSGKIKIIKAVREMKPIANGFDELLNDAREKLKGENHDEMAEKALNKGEAEIIVAKNRNGPVGSVKLLFQNNITKFKNPIKTDVF